MKNLRTFGQFVNEGKEYWDVIAKEVANKLKNGYWPWAIKNGVENITLKNIKSVLIAGGYTTNSGIKQNIGGILDKVSALVNESVNEAKLPIDKSWRFGGGIIEFFDSIPALKKYRDPDATYDDAHFTIPIKDFKKIVGWTEKEVDEIDNRLEDYEGYIAWMKDEVIVGDGA